MIQWMPVTERKPDGDTTVLLFNLDAVEPVWLGYRDDSGDQGVCGRHESRAYSLGRATTWPESHSNGCRLMKITLIACSATKLTRPAPAYEIYQGALFGKAWKYACATSDVIGILSAEYGLLLPDQVISPYEKSLNAMNTRERIAWATKVFKQLEQQWPLFQEPVELVFLTGQHYRKDLIKTLHSSNSLKSIQNQVLISEPMKGMPIGKQMQWLGRQINHLCL